MTEDIKEYTNGEITVIWKPRLCINSKICWETLLAVFDPAKRPWINMEGASTDKIIECVDACPSKALSYYNNNGE